MHANAGLQDEFFAALDTELALVGPEKFLVEPVVKRFAERGAVHAATLYRWAAAWRRSPRPAVAVDAVIKEADARAERERTEREREVEA